MNRVPVVALESSRRVAASKATFAFALAFSVLTLAVSYFGLAGYRTAGFQGLGRVAMSLMNLVVYLVPLIALMLGTAEVTGRREALGLVLAQPVRRSEVLLGSYLGVAGALSLALIIGLASGGLIIALQVTSASWEPFLVLLGVSELLLLAFLGVAYLLGVLFLDRLRSMAAALLIWFVCVVGYDLALIGLTSVLRGVPLKALLLPAILLNPVDLTRVMVTLATERGALFGPAGATLVETFGRPGGAALAGGALVTQVALPLWIAIQVFQRRDL